MLYTQCWLRKQNFFLQQDSVKNCNNNKINYANSQYIFFWSELAQLTAYIWIMFQDGNKKTLLEVKLAGIAKFGKIGEFATSHNIDFSLEEGT